MHRSTVYARATVNFKGRHMSYAYKLNEDVQHLRQGPQGRAETDQPMIYTIVQCMPIEADGRLRYRIRSKSGNIERVVTEDQLSYSQ
jgi:hypothetical protein